MRNLVQNPEVNIGSATLSVTADGVEIKNDAGSPIPIIGGLSIPAHDNIQITYRTTGNGVGKIDQVIYKVSSTTVGTLTLAYDASNRLSTVTKS